MRSSGMLLLSLLAGAVLAAPAAAGPPGTDTGIDKPPRALADDAKSIWMTEWVPCWRVRMSHLSKVLHIPITSGMTPQEAATKLANRAVHLLYGTTEETQTAADGCRNGILWRFYHPEP